MKLRFVLDEAIRLTQHAAKITAAVEAAVRATMIKFSGIHNRFDRPCEKSVRDNNISPLLDMMYSPTISIVSRLIERAMNSVCNPSDNPQHIKIDIRIRNLNNDDVNGYTRGPIVVVNEVLIANLVGRLVRLLATYSLQHHSEEVHMHKVFLQSLKDSNFQDKMLVAVKNDIHTITGVLLHELTHAFQHAQQHEAGRTKMAYKSYGDTKQTSLSILSMIGRDNLTPEETKKYDKLYYASPQEIGAFVNNIVYDMITELHIEPNGKYKTVSQIPGIEHHIATQVEQYMSPKTDRERMVVKRYMKLVYQELQSYLDSYHSQSSKD